MILNYKWEEYRENIGYLEKEPETYLKAIKAAKEKHKFTIGVFYRNSRPVYHKALYGDHNPINKKTLRDTRLDKIHKIVQSK